MDQQCTWSKNWANFLTALGVHVICFAFCETQQCQLVGRATAFETRIWLTFMGIGALQVCAACHLSTQGVDVDASSLAICFASITGDICVRPCSCGCARVGRSTSWPLSVGVAETDGTPVPLESPPGVVGLLTGYRPRNLAAIVH